MEQELKVSVGSLFAGIGGVELGFERAGFEIRWANEIDRNACVTYRLNHKHKLLEGDLKELSTIGLEKVDVLTAGFPCQPFSVAGKGKGFKDRRGSVFFEVLRFLEDMRPKVVLLENVRGLQVHDGGRTFATVIREVSCKGYHIKYVVLNSAEYGGVPQNRERVYIVGFKDRGAYNSFEFPKKKRLTRTVSDLLLDEVATKYYYGDSKYYEQLKREMVNVDAVYQLRRTYVRENKSGLCPTLTANMGTGGHNVPLITCRKGIRKLTPRECARLQGFDDSFVLSSGLADSLLYKQIGNSVTVPLIEQIAKQIKKVM